MNVAPPIGTATVVLGDVAGSTRLWQQDADAMAAASRRLRTIAEELAATHGGHLPREQGEGDNLVAAFASAGDAATFALALDAALAAEVWPGGLTIGMRLGLHTGDVEWDEATGYLGPTFNRCARLRDLGHARMVLLSQATRDIVADALPDGARIEDLGRQQLRDLSRDEHVFQLRGADDDGVYEPLKSVTSLPNNLPVPVDTLVGREDDILRTSRSLLDHRLVTLTGPGGSGKTRLAQHVGAGVLSYAPDGAWWVDLMPVQEEERVAAAIADAAGVPEVGTGRSAALTLAGGLGDRELLLLLDNCEHVIDAVADTVELLLARCPNVRVLATSREMLDVAGEHAVRVRPLGVADSPEPSLHDLQGSPATALFLERATMLDAEALDADGRRAVAAICRRLDGMPLAIELAAARTRALGVTDIETGLDDRFSLLTAGGRRRRGSSRQRTLEASIAWSWELLEEDEAAMLARLSVFPAAFDLDGAVAVGALGVGGPDTLDVLTALVDKSLIAVRPAEDRARYRLLESIRHYGLDRLAELGEADAARDAHLQHTITQLRARNELQDADGMALAGTLRDDIRTATSWALSTGRPNAVVDLCWPTYVSRTIDGTYHEVTAALLEIRDDERLDLEHDAKAYSLLIAYLSTGNRQRDAEELAERGLELARSCGNPFVLHATMTAVLNGRAWIGLDCGDLAREALTHARAHADDWTEAAIVQVAPYVTLGLAYSGSEQQAFDVAIELTDAARRVGMPHFEALLASYAAGMNSRLSRPVEEHAQLLAHAVAAVPANSPRLHTAISVIPGVFASSGLVPDDVTDAWVARAAAHAGPPGSITHAMVLAGRAWCSLIQHDDAASALPLARAAHAAVSKGQNLWWQVVTGALLVNALVDTGELEAASTLVARLDEQVADVHPQGIVLARGALLAASAALLVAGGRSSLTVDGIVTLLRTAHDVGYRGVAHFTQHVIHALAVLGEPGTAAVLHGWADATVAGSGRVMVGRLGRGRADALAAIRDAIGDERFAQLAAEGAASDLGAIAARLAPTAGDGDLVSGDRPVSGWDALTPAEVDVARKVAEGLTNKEAGEALFVSENTVKTHLKSVYAKLDVSSRAELATLVATTGAARVRATDDRRDGQDID